MSEPFQFLSFSLVVVALYHALGSPALRRVLIPLANAFFLVTFFTGVRSAAPLLLFLAGGFAGLRLIQYRRAAFLPVLLATLCAFVWIKKYTFVPHALFLQFTYETVGLSYILFRVLHLMIESSSGGVEARVGAISFFNYTAGFTTLVSGPIQGYPEWAGTEDPAVRPRLTGARAAAALERIVRGLFRTNVLALVLSALQSRMLDAVSAGGPPGAKVAPGALALALYPLFLYCNFAGYMDIVIGVGALLGVELPENFMRPFASGNVIEFWSSRWHITLSQWLRNYVYSPLMMTLMRRFSSPALEPVWAVLAFFVTFFLIGIWHGQTGEFIFYGFILGLGVSVNKIYQILMTGRLGRKRYRALCANGIYIAICRGLTFTWITFTTIWFWADWHRIRLLATALAPRMALVVALIFVSATAGLAVWEAAYRRTGAAMAEAPALWSWCLRVAQGTAEMVATVGAAILMNRPAPGIVYKAF